MSCFLQLFPSDTDTESDTVRLMSIKVFQTHKALYRCFFFAGRHRAKARNDFNCVLVCGDHCPGQAPLEVDQPMSEGGGTQRKWEMSALRTLQADLARNVVYS